MLEKREFEFSSDGYKPEIYGTALNKRGSK